MSVRPFYIKRGDMTKVEVDIALLKCVTAGARAYEGHERLIFPQHRDSGSWEYFGVDWDNQTYIDDYIGGYGTDAVEITLGQLDAWLAGDDLDKEPEAAPTPTKEECIATLESMGYKVTLENKEVKVGQVWGGNSYQEKTITVLAIIKDTVVFYWEDSVGWVHARDCKIENFHDYYTFVSDGE